MKNALKWILCVVVFLFLATGLSQCHEAPVQASSPTTPAMTKKVFLPMAGTQVGAGQSSARPYILPIGEPRLVVVDARTPFWIVANLTAGKTYCLEVSVEGWYPQFEGDTNPNPPCGGDACSSGHAEFTKVTPKTSGPHWFTINNLTEETKGTIGIVEVTP